MRCTDRWRAAGLLTTGLVAGCNSHSPATENAASPSSAPVSVPAPTPVAVKKATGTADPLPLPAPGPARNWAELRRQAARRIVAANPQGTYMGTVPDALLAIPVLEIELKRDGSIDRILILRAPRQATDTSQLAIAAVRRAAPFGDVSKLPRPWKFTETFLFDDDRKFKPRTLDE